MKIINLESRLQHQEKFINPLTNFEKTKMVQIQLKKGIGIPEHHVDADVLIIVKKGKVEFEVAGERVELSPSSILYMEPKEQHSLLALEDVELLLLRIER
ncbi:MAG: cupin domain-containing protein [Candidatus Pristimantibacillus lignocellulolyticus]|uniref:Cupin domain-containing protein n=1 Tax=Candidatus Pristimantibacillus lignocellulolyticus TaxID=2994561 RepID=A0A9J6ZEY2_9BACL|nr:MAG: cupin domain-containing protein [Candidatus Pristimantibacillus lignocellulolyticus]